MNNVSGKAKLRGPASLVHSPQEAASAYVRWAEFNRVYPGVTFGVPALDRRVIPLRPGRMACLIARPGHGKTSLMATLARREAHRIRAAYPDVETPPECVVYVSWEQVIEEVESFFEAGGQISASDVAWGRADAAAVMQQSFNRAALPIWTVGYSLDGTTRDTPEMNLANVLAAIESMQADFGVKPTLICLDYMQIIPAAGYDDRVKRVAEMPAQVKRLAGRLGVAALVGVQASREVDDLKVKLPEMGHAQWGSSIEQAGDLVLSLWRPAVTEDLGSVVKVGEKQFPVQEELLFVRMLKQRGDSGRWTWALYFEPQHLRLCELETQLTDMADEE